ncbi:MAG TPA: MFS transporter, partial [Gemmatimonadales bacterium]|nr:MFS transporter [Gemmatimonadales bacterium]
MLGILAPTLQRELSWSESQYGDVVSWFSLVYAFGFLFAGRWLDRVGVRRGFATAVVVWSLAAIGHAFARTTAAFSAARALLGLGESANFPGAIKTVAEWFPKDERALATGIFNAGTNTGAIITPLLVPWIALTWGWRWAFIATGSIGFLWLLLWLALYRSPPADAHPDEPDEPRVPWIRLLGVRQTWAIVVGKMLADPIWWFYLYWLPKFLDAKYGIKLAQVALPLIVVYLVADVGSIAGGWLSSRLIKLGWTVNRARKTAMLAMALVIMPTALAPHAGSMWTAVLLVSVAAAAHQGWSANMYTLASDMFPRSAVASISGIGGFAGAMGGV